ncbi:uncharacterized protein Dmoj_GI16772 [Drosophila mojavensis]|uniref:DUF4485 domain-containing protein n=1 Tax=Drosophila mojavensis TaxID=7230 RepID=B4L936_DROMO|nr:uncharacterized protein Dmoj_GI16772 [Drosophila mojavensis]
MMKEPNEKWLDRHFAQQLEEYEPVFRQEASESDQEIISYWLQIFLAAPKPQKWARNSLMLLMYGHLKEIGYLQVPFTDVNSMGKNLNEVLDGYTGLPVVITNRTHSTHVLTPIPEERTLSQHDTEPQTPSPPETEVQTPSPPETDAYTGLSVVATNRTYSTHVLTPIHEEQTPSPPESEMQTPSPPESEMQTPSPPESEMQTASQFETEESTTVKEGSDSNRSASIKRLFSCRSSFEEATLAQESKRNSASHSASARSSSHQTLYETFDSHECYQSKTERKLCAAESKRMLEVEAVIESMQRLDRSPLSTISEESINIVNESASRHSYSQLFKEIIKSNEEDSKQMQSVDSASSRVSSELTEKRLVSAAGRQKEMVRIEPTTRRSLESSWGSPGQTTRRVNSDADLMYLRRRNKQLRRECLIYYHKNGKLRKHPKYPRIMAQALGFQVAAYRAHARLARWQIQNKVPQYFHQEYDRSNGWRTYRRILMAIAVPRSRLRRTRNPGRVRPRMLLHMSHIVQHKNIYTEMSASQISYGHGYGHGQGQGHEHEMHCFWAQNLALADHLQCNPRKTVE